MEVRKAEQSFNKKLFTLVLPIALQNFMFAAVSASDAIMLGFLNQEYLSAVSLAGQIQFVLSLFFAALTIGTTILAAQYWGKGNKRAVEQIQAIVIKLSFCISFLFFIAAAFFADALMKIFTNDLYLIDKGAIYLKIVGVSYLFGSISQIILCIMKNSGKAMKSTLISSFSMMLNILLNAILIFGLMGFPALGIAGAAIATVISRGIEMVWAVIDARGKNSVQLKLKFLLRSEKVLLTDLMKYTLPVLGNELIWGCGFTMYTVIMGHLGNDAVAANSIANIVKNIVACVCLGIGSGGGIVVGNELGKGNLVQAKQSGNHLCKISIISGIISGIILLSVSPFILYFVNLSEIAQEYLRGMLVMCSYYMIGKAVNSTVIAGIFCSGGDSKFGLFCDAIVMWIIVIPIGLIAAFQLKVPVLMVYFIINLDEMLKLPFVYRHYKQYGWVKDLTKEF